MTLSAWIYSTDFPINDAAIVSSTQDGVAGFQLDTTIDNGPRTIGFKLTDASGARMSRYGATVIPLNQFVHVAGVYDATAQTMTVYFNGVLDNGVTVGTVAATQKPSTLHVLIGQRAGAVGYPFIGTIDEVRIYNRALSQAEIQADMNAAIVPPPDTVAPTAPTGLAATPSTNQITLTWTASTDNVGVAGYQVERCAGAGCANFAQIGTTTFSTRFLDTGVALVTTYNYRVRADDYAGNLSAYSSVASATTLSPPPGAGRVGAYAFSEGTGATTADSSGLGNNGTLVNGPVWTTAGKFGNALSFNGGTQSVDIGNAPSLQISGSMTLSAWIYSTAFPSNDAAIVSSTQAATAGFQLDTTADNGPRTIGFKLTDASGARMSRYGATVIPLNQFVHVAGVYDATAQTMTVYFNGALDNGVTVGTVASSQQISTLHVLIGQRPDVVGGYPFIGTIDEVRIYNRALSQAEIQADMNASVTAAPADVYPPAAPTNLAAAATSATQINLSWTASTDNVAVTGYLLERCQGAGCSTFAQIATPATTSFTDTGLTGATSYSYRVRATDAAGNIGAYSNVATATTAAGGAQGQIFYIEPDHLNTPRLIANSTGTTVWRWDQGEPFGSDVPNNNPSGAGAFDFPLRFPGQYFDRETGLAYNYFRDYDAAIGRYIQSDPIGLKGGINTYAYVRSEPMRLVDPTGMQYHIILQYAFSCFLSLTIQDKCVYTCGGGEKRCILRPLGQCGYPPCQKEVLRIFTLECPDPLVPTIPPL
jgi:RHS repeat-associated protein